MSRHLPECPYAQPCPTEWRKDELIRENGLPIPHRIVSGSSGRCVECDAGDCLCYEMRAKWNAALDAAEAAVVYLRDERRMVGLAPALSAIRALKETP